MAILALEGLIEAAGDRFWYLGTVYTQHPVNTREAYREAIYLGGLLAKGGVKFYSPIVHWHPIAFDALLPKDHDYWMAMDEPMMQRCDGMIYAMMKNHSLSRGMAHEKEFFRRQHKRVLFWDPDLDPDTDD